MILNTKTEIVLIVVLLLWAILIINVSLPEKRQPHVKMPIYSLESNTRPTGAPPGSAFHPQPPDTKKKESPGDIINKGVNTRDIPIATHGRVNPDGSVDLYRENINASY